MTKEQIIKKLELYQEKSTSMEAAMSFGVAIKLVLGLDAEQGPEEASKDWIPKEGDWVCVRDYDYEGWKVRRFVRFNGDKVVALTHFGHEMNWSQYKPL